MKYLFQMYLLLAESIEEKHTVIFKLIEKYFYFIMTFFRENIVFSQVLFCYFLMLFGLQY